MLEAAARLAVAAGIAIGIGLRLRLYLLHVLPGLGPGALVARAFLLCATGVSIYLAVAGLFGVSELGDLKRLLLRRLGFSSRGAD
jgi:hypothetical protein